MKKQFRLCILALGLAVCGSVASAQQTASSTRDGLGITTLDQNRGAAPRDRDRDAWCVGGPVGPAFAYSDYDVANECAGKVASFSRACRQAVRISRCEVFQEYSINALNPGYCTCGGGGGYVGIWE